MMELWAMYGTSRMVFDICLFPLPWNFDPDTLETSRAELTVMMPPGIFLDFQGDSWY